MKEVKKVNLICLTFAGGNKFSYRIFFDKVPGFLNLLTLEYSGRGKRVGEPLMGNLTDIVEDLYLQISTFSDLTPFVFYGHSMGALVAYLLTLKLRSSGQHLPAQLILSGASGPSAPSRSEKKRFLLSKNEFIQEVRRMGGMPDELMESDDLLDFFEPILRNDFKAIETYIHEENEPLDIPVTVITGMSEDLLHEEILLWSQITKKPVEYKRMPGGHFFIFERVEQFLEIIIKKTHCYIPKSHENRIFIS